MVICTNIKKLSLGWVGVGTAWTNDALFVRDGGMDQWRDYVYFSDCVFCDHGIFYGSSI